MVSKCPHCKESFALKDSHKAKIQNALAKVKPGHTLKFACPKCKQPIEVGQDGELFQKNTLDAPPAPKKEKAPPRKAEAKPAEPEAPPPSPPKAPDISWIQKGEMEKKEIVRDVPTAMVIIPEGNIRDLASDAFLELDYQIYYPKTIDEAIESTRFKDYVAIAYHAHYEQGPLDEQDFHKYMKLMSMTKRRYIYYILIGTEFNTLYDLEALTYSANLVVNENEAKYLSMILKKGMLDYEDLFGPYLAMLKSYGKK